MPNYETRVIDLSTNLDKTFNITYIMREDCSRM